jgi:two-component system sensor kinase FixL
LTAVANYAAALKRILANSDHSATMADDILDKIMKQRERASRIVARLRNQVARRSAERQMENLEGVVAEALELVASTVQKANVSLQVEAHPPLPPVFIDRVQIQQVIINIVRNAVEAMERTEIRQLILSMHPQGSNVRLDIADFGPGLSKEIGERLFEPFVTTKSSGMGLGLSICKNIIETHGGELSARANEPHGTVFSILLPASDDRFDSGVAAQ